MENKRMFAVSEDAMVSLMNYLQAQPIKEYNKVKPIMDILVKSQVVKIQEDKPTEEKPPEV